MMEHEEHWQPRHLYVTLVGATGLPRCGRSVAAGRVLAGRARLVLDGEPAMMAAGSGVVLPPFSRLAVEQPTADFGLRLAIMPLHDGWPDHLRQIVDSLLSVEVSRVLSPPLATVIQHIFAALETLSASCAEDGTSTGYALCHALLAALAGGNKAPVATCHYRRFTTLLAEQIPRQRDVAEYARQLGLTPRRLGDVCREVAGRAPKDIITEWTVGFIKRVLLSSSAPVGALAAEYGFSSASNFVRLFSDATGLTPALFRKAHTKD